MGSKAQAKASSEYAKFMKDRGITRTRMNCPVGCGAYISMRAIQSPGFSHVCRSAHFAVWSGSGRSVSAKRMPSLDKVVSQAVRKVDANSRKLAATIDLTYNNPAPLPPGWGFLNKYRQTEDTFTSFERLPKYTGATD